MYLAQKICLTIALSVGWLGSSSATDKIKDSSTKPNFLFIIADDQSPFDLKAYNANSQLQSPEINRLAAQGIVIDGAYHMGAWAGGVCTPSRHMIMSGRTLWHIPDKSKRSRNPQSSDRNMVPPNLAQFTMPAVFNRAGYETFRTCKNGNSYTAANQLFKIKHTATKRGGTTNTGSSWHADQVLDYLSSRKKGGNKEPFLIYFGFSHPHDPRNGTPELLAKYGSVNHTDKGTLPPAHQNQPPLPKNYLPSHPFHHGHPNLRDEVAVNGVWKKRDERTIRNEIGRQFACSENIDTQIGRVINKLKSLEEYNNTYIIYTSDHGMAIGRHGLQGKQNLYEHTWRVPLIVKGPGIKAGSRARGNIYLLDVLGTLCDLAGIKAPDTCESVSFKEVLMGRKETVREILYGAYSGGTKPGIRCVKKGDWKLIKYDVMDGTVRKTQLFNLRENPYEFISEHGKANKKHINLSKQPEHAEKLSEMEATLLTEMQKHDDPFRMWDQPKKSPN